jgi:hypothetical protein
MIQMRLSNDRLLDFLEKARPRGCAAAPAQVLPGHRPPQHRQRGDLVSVCPMANAEGETLPTHPVKLQSELSRLLQS